VEKVVGHSYWSQETLPILNPNPSHDNLINEILPRGLAKVILHLLFFAPGGRQNHFVAKDNHLENQNYWLKFFFNHTGK
jgi:hypothetical protein